MGAITVVNRSTETVQCQISNKSGGSAGWYTLQPGETESWGRNGWENVAIKAGNRQSGLWVNRGYPAVVTFLGFDKELIVDNENPPPGAFTVDNKSPTHVSACVSGGAWKEIAAGTSYKFDDYDGWHTVAFKNSDDSVRKGVYITNHGTNATVDFNGFDQEITSKDGPVNAIRAEHFAEAIAIADRSYAAQNSRASNPGGLVASVEKVDILESMTPGGRTQSLWNNNQIYTLAMLINHLKYGLGEGGIVVSVKPDWVKVAAYTCEFDAIVVLGFPMAAAKLVAPERLTVGERVLVVSQFTYRQGNMQGVQADITMGPRTLNKWYNFHPIVAQFVTDDSFANVWAERMPPADDQIWPRIWEQWEAWKIKHGENYFRLGAPSLVTIEATSRPVTQHP